MVFYFCMHQRAIFITLLLIVFISVSCSTSALPKCYNNSYIRGSWKHDPTVRKSFYCCGWDEFDFRHDATKCFNSTEYSHNNLFLLQGSNDLLAHSGGHGCSCDARGSR